MPWFCHFDYVLYWHHIFSQSYFICVILFLKVAIVLLAPLLGQFPQFVLFQPVVLCVEVVFLNCAEKNSSGLGVCWSLYFRWSHQGEGTQIPDMNLSWLLDYCTCNTLIIFPSTWSSITSFSSLFNSFGYLVGGDFFMAVIFIVKLYYERCQLSMLVHEDMILCPCDLHHSHMHNRCSSTTDSLLLTRWSWSIIRQ